MSRNEGGSPSAVLVDLLMATMDSMSVWASAAGDRERGLAWRDAVTDRMIAAEHYISYEGLVVAAAADLDLPRDAPQRLEHAWKSMQPWPDAGALERLHLPYAFVTNCSTDLAVTAVERSGLRPEFTLSAEEAGWYKPRPEIYRLACRRVGVDPAQVWFVAGAPYDAAGAAAAGLRALLVRRRPHRERLSTEIDTAPSLEDALRDAIPGGDGEC